MPGLVMACLLRKICSMTALPARSPCLHLETSNIVYKQYIITICAWHPLEERQLKIFGNQKYYATH
ncbi:MAG TPA: hypothetical protein DEF07_00380 [Nitrosomonas sp.]|nr:hypothetical protein [Nitrosomonas sp.]